MPVLEAEICHAAPRMDSLGCQKQRSLLDRAKGNVEKHLDTVTGQMRPPHAPEKRFPATIACGHAVVEARVCLFPTLQRKWRKGVAASKRAPAAFVNRRAFYGLDNQQIRQ